jgi:sugar lactone lactonase YvrE
VTTGLQRIVEGLTFPEGLRWRDGRLWFSDFYSNAVYATDLSGNCEKIAEVPGQPSGLGWLPNGDLLISSMIDQMVMRWCDGTLLPYADLSPFARYHINELITDSRGRAYVGNFGFDPHTEAPRKTSLILVNADAKARIVADDLAFPNGMALIDDERVLIVAESVAQCLTAFDVGDDGSLSNRRIFARFDGCQPDGICASASGDIWVTTMMANQLVQFDRSGARMATMTLDHPCWSCAVTGDPADGVIVALSDHSAGDDCLTNRSSAIAILRR